MLASPTCLALRLPPADFVPARFRFQTRSAPEAQTELRTSRFRDTADLPVRRRWRLSAVP